MRQLVSASLPVSDNTGLVFVGHSLGGLMLKAALEQASRSDDTKERRLVERCVGVAFIGTPHSGSGLASLLANLDKLLGTIGTGARFATSGAPFSNRAFNLRLRAACRALGVGEITAHGLRHSAATILLNHVGKDLREIQELPRHKNIRTTVRYTHVGYEQTRQTAEALSDALE
jgi:integrase